jgi:uncharacterized repeat protein (TIGR01451 family)
MIAGAAVLVPSEARGDDFAAGSLIIPMDTTYQDNGMLKAYGLVYSLLRQNVPVRWVIRQGKAHLGVDFTASGIDHKTKAAIASHGYRGGPWVIDQANAAAAIPIIDAWQTANPAVAVHEVTAPFSADVARRLVLAPTIAMHQDGNEGIARGYLQAAGIPDSTLNPAWPNTSPDMLTPAEVAGPSTTNHHDGKLFDADGDPVYCQFMSMHWSTNDAAASPETVLEVREFLQHPVHFFAECQAVNAFEGAPPVGGRGNFLTSQGFAWPAPAQPKNLAFYNSDSPFAQIDGTFKSVGGSEPAYSLAMGSAYAMGGVVMIKAQGTIEGTQDLWMTGFLDGVCPPEWENCSNNYGKISYLGGHQYSTNLPISSNPTTQGTRLFLNSLFEAPCATQGGQPQISLTKIAPSSTGTANVTFDIDYANSGPGVALAALISDALPAGATFVSASSGYTLSGNTVTWSVGNLGSFESGRVSVTVHLPSFGTYSNTANVQYNVGINSFSKTSNTTSTRFDVDTDGDGVIDAFDICPTNYNPAQDLQTDIMSCGTCGTICTAANGTPGCGAGQCLVASCNAGFSDCDGLYANGCEYDNSGFQNDTANCGGCKKICAPQHATAACTAGSCQIGSCNSGFSNCNGVINDGCEYDNTGFSHDPANCNGCGLACNMGYTCRSSACVISGCPAGTEDCDAQQGNGCETNTQTDNANCGGCGLVCAPQHANGVCVAGHCTIGSCATGFSDCDGLPSNGCEYDNTGFPSDPNNCGACGVSCTAGHAAGICQAGACKVTGCATGYSDCDGLPANGCEYDNTGFPTDPNHCGSCATSCARAHAPGVCTGGTCTLGPCEPGYVDLDGKEGNGCECHKVSTTDTTCDGVDDDCNGVADDAYVPTTCGLGTCASTSRCQNGSATTCKPGVGSLEGPSGDPTCSDGADNDCDGLMDDADPDCRGNADAGVADASADAGTGLPDGSSIDAGSDGRIATTDGGLDVSDGGVGVGGASAGGAAGAGASAGTGSGGATAGAAGSRTGGVGGSAGNGGVAGSIGSSEDAQGGCGCRVGQRSQRATWPVAAVLIGCVVARRRARRKDAGRDNGALPKSGASA